MKGSALDEIKWLALIVLVRRILTNVNWKDLLKILRVSTIIGLYQLRYSHRLQDMDLVE